MRRARLVEELLALQVQSADAATGVAAAAALAAVGQMAVRGGTAATVAHNHWAEPSCDRHHADSYFSIP